MNIVAELATWSPPDAITLLRLPRPLLQPSSGSGSGDAEWTEALANFLAGESTWSALVQKELERGEVLHAMDHVGFAQADGSPVSLELSNRVTAESVTLRQSLLDDAERLRSVIDGLANGVLGDVEAAILRRRVDDFLHGSQRHDSLDAASALRCFIEDHDSLKLDVAAASELEREDREQRAQRVHWAAEAAWRRLVGNVGSPKPMSPDDSQLLCALPHLILDADIERLEKIASGQPLADVAPPNLGILAFSSRVQIRRPAEPLSARKLAPPELSPISQAIVRQAPDRTIRLDTPQELEEHKVQARRLVDDRQRALYWLGMKSSDPGLMRALLGEGLLCEGIERLRSREFLHARKILTDALTCIVEAGSAAESSLERAAIALSAAWAWPPFLAMASAKQAGGDIVRSWLDNPSIMVDDLRSVGLRHVLANVWSDELTPETANKYFDAIGATFGDEGLLLQAAARSLITPTNLLKKPDRVRDGIRWLLRGDGALPEAEVQLGELFEETAPEALRTLTTRESARASSELIANTLRSLRNLRQGAPVPEVANLLVDVVTTVTQSKDPIGSDPQVTLQPLVHVLFPEERDEEIELPVLLRNADDAAPARDVSVILRLDGTISNPPTITTDTVNLGTLNPGESRQGTFYLRVPADAAERVNEFGFRIELRTGARTSSRGIRIFVQSGSRQHKSSPYVTGTAVSGMQFVGREREMTRIVGALTGDVEQKPLLVYGIRRIGKTSILQQTVTHPEIKRRFHTIYWSLEDRSETDTSSAFLMELCRRVRDRLPEDLHSRVEFHRESFRTDPYAAFETFSDTLERLGLSKPVLLVLDEFDKLIHNARLSTERTRGGAPGGPANSFQPEVFAALRKALMGKRALHLVLGGLPEILKQHYGERFFGLLEPIEVTPLDRKDAIKIIEAGEPHMKVHALAREAVLRASGLQPYLLQVICNALFHRAKFSGRDLVCTSDVRDVIESQILPAESYFTDYASLIRNEWPVLWALARAQKDAPESREYVSLHDVQEALRSEGLAEWTEEARAALDSVRASPDQGLGERPLVARNPSRRDSYKLIIGVLGEYLIRQGPHR